MLQILLQRRMASGEAYFIACLTCGLHKSLEAVKYKTSSDGGLSRGGFGACSGFGACGGGFGVCVAIGF